MRPIANVTLHTILAACLVAFAASSAAAADAYLKLGGVKGEAAKTGSACTDEGCDDNSQPAFEVQSYWWGVTHGVAASNLNSSKSNREASAPSVSEIAVNDPGADGKKPDRVAAGDVNGDGRADVVSASTSSPRDASSGLPTGKRQHKPITVTKEWDKATPVLTSPPAQGSLTVEARVPGCAVGKHYDEATLLTLAYKYEFKDVFITSCALSGMGSGGSSQQPMESISFNYARIATKATTAADKMSWDLVMGKKP